MELKYLAKLKKWTDRYGLKEERVSEAQISAIEVKLGKKFPLAYREFLLLTGHYFLAMPINHRLSYLIEREIQSLAITKLKEFGITLREGFWVFAENEGAEVIFFFYFDEGDDPPVHVCEMQMKDESDYEYLRKRPSFSEFINFYVDNYNPKYYKPNK